MTDPIVTALIGRRYRLGLTQADVADVMGVARSLVGRIEADRQRVPTIATLQRYAAAVGARITIEDNT